MPGKYGAPEKVISQDEFISRFSNTLKSIDIILADQVDFKLQIQKNNLMVLVNEANERLERYEQIYPYIKELCKGQTINPAWYGSIEKVLNWALKKGSVGRQIGRPAHDERRGHGRRV